VIIIIIGPPGSGKSTQSKMLAEVLGIPAISMGKVLRDVKKKGTIIGREANKYVEEGKLVPSKLMEALTKFRLEEDDCKDGFVLDGAPRRVEEAVVLDEYLLRKGEKVEYVILIDLSDEIAIDRILKRKTKSKKKGGGREDDNVHDIKVRLREYHDNIEAIKVYYNQRDILQIIDGRPSVEAIHNQIRALFQL
jgi:adenylate kinase